MAVASVVTLGGLVTRARFFSESGLSEKLGPLVFFDDEEYSEKELDDIAGRVGGDTDLALYRGPMVQDSPHYEVLTLQLPADVSPLEVFTQIDWSGPRTETVPAGAEVYCEQHYAGAAPNRTPIGSSCLWREGNRWVVLSHGFAPKERLQPIASAVARDLQAA